MKRQTIAYNVFAGGLCLLILAATLTAQETETRQRKNQARNRDRAQAGNLDDKTTGATIRASQLIGMNIHNSQDEGVGEVDDIVLDANTGRVRYLAVTYGGFLGVGDELFAVPFEAFQVSTDPGDRDEYRLVLNVTQKQLEGAQGFDKDHWPDFADRKFTADLDKRYGIDRRAMRNRDRNVDLEINRNGVDLDVDSENEKD